MLNGNSSPDQLREQGTVMGHTQAKRKTEKSLKFISIGCSQAMNKLVFLNNDKENNWDRTNK